MISKETNELALCWQNLSLYVTVEHRTWLGKSRLKRLKLLNNVSGIVRSGTLCAIMGPSGAGKTTLLAAISQRNTGAIQGEIHMNGCPIDKNLMLKMSGFVPQQDLAIKSLTVHEHLFFMAVLKMDKRVSRLQLDRVVSALLTDLNLLSCSNTQLSQLSGGEMKRVSLAVQLVTDPPILLCDEPTTGLDSYSAASVVSLLRDLASKGKAVICSLHQPASGIFEMFDSVCLLVPGGRLAYFGEVRSVNEYFQSLGFVCPPTYNIAEFLLTTLSEHPHTIWHHFSRTEAYSLLDKELDAVKTDMKTHQLIYGMDERFLKFYSVQLPSQKTQLRWLLWRSILDLYRNAKAVILKFSLFAMTAFFVSTPYAGTKLNQEGIQNIQGMNYSVITETVFVQAYAVMHTFPTEIPILLREIGNGVYKPAPYYLSKVLVILPRAILEAIVFALIVYLIAGVEKSAYGFFWFALPVVICSISTSAYGCCISAMFENMRTASLLAVPFDFVSYTFSGLFLQLNSASLYLSWIKYTSRFFYGLEAMSILQWKDIENIPCSDNPDIPCITNGNSVLFNYGYHPGNLLLDLLCLLLMFFLLHLVGYYFLLKRSKKQSMY